ncbi:MAG: secretin N-terminal domain-containing protein [Planctomycetota bacterium]
MYKSCLLILLLCPFIAQGQDGETPEPLSGDIDNRIAVGTSGLLDIRLHETDIFYALELLSEQVQCNIVTHSGVSGNVSMVLRKVSFEEALHAILAANNLTYETRDNIIYVMPKPAVVAEVEQPVAQEMRVFHLSYISAADAETFIKPLLTKDCSVARTEEPEVGIGADAESAGGFSPAGGEALIVVGPPVVLELIARAIAEIDVRPAQVLVEATIMRATLNENNSLGIDFNTLTGVDFQLMQANSPGITDISVGNLPHKQLDDYTTTIRTDFNDLISGGGFTFGIIKDQVAAFIRALEEITDVTVTANPKILTLNKQRGEVIVGRRDGYLTTTVTETVAVQTVEYLETGTKLIFRPFVTRDGYVRMEIHPEDSNGGLTAANLPFQETTEATTNILIRDGHTILIGGLFRERTTTGRSQVPVVGNIPVLGHLFGVQQDSTTREEVIILLTVHILDDSESEIAVFEELNQEIERLRIGSRRGLMGTGRELLAEARYRAAVDELRAGDVEAALSAVEWALHLQPRHTDAIRLREKLLNERTWHAEGAPMRAFVRELLRVEAGLPRRAVFGRPDVEALLNVDHTEKTEAVQEDEE